MDICIRILKHASCVSLVSTVSDVVLLGLHEMGDGLSVDGVTTKRKKKQNPKLPQCVKCWHQPCLYPLPPLAAKEH